MLGTWACLCDPEKTVTIEAAMKESFPNLLTLQGCAVTEEDGWEETMAEDVQKAAKCDVIVACVGEDHTMSGEAASRSDLTLPGHQKELLSALLATGKPVVLVVSAGRPLVLSDYQDKASAIVYTWHLGTEGGRAVCDVLTGRHNPSGHLTVSFPRSSSALPVYYNHLSTGKPVLHKRRFEAKYQDIEAEALYPFGYGKSYTEFTYSHLTLSSNAMTKEGAITISVDVENSGALPGADVVQLYVRDLVASRVRPIKELKGYHKLTLSPGEKQTVTFNLRASDLAFTDMNMERVVEAGDFQCWIAHDSQDNALEAAFQVIE